MVPPKNSTSIMVQLGLEPLTSISGNQESITSPLGRRLCTETLYMVMSLSLGHILCTETPYMVLPLSLVHYAIYVLNTIYGVASITGPLGHILCTETPYMLMSLSLGHILSIETP